MQYLYSRFFLRRNIIALNKRPVGFCTFKIRSWSIVFFGSDVFSLCSLQELHKQMKEKVIKRIEVVVTNERSCVYTYAMENGFKTHIWPPNLNGSYDFGVIVSFGKLIPENIIDKFPMGIINVHGSLLPKYRGGMPIAHAIKNGETSTGVTITKITPDKFDVGEILLQKPCLIGETELNPSVYNRLSAVGCDCLLQVIKSLPESFEKSFSQCEEDASYAPKLKKDAAVVRWNEMTALEIFNLYRALFGIFDLTSSWQGKPVQFLCLSLCDPHLYPLVNKNVEPGCFIYDRKTKFIYVQCKNGLLVVCTLRFNNIIYKASSFKKYLKKSKNKEWKFGM